MTDFYSLYKNNTNENEDVYHLFESTINSGHKCIRKSEKSLCGKINKSHIGEPEHRCLNENKAREECATIGREVCGVCVSSLYSQNE